MSYLPYEPQQQASWAAAHLANCGTDVIVSLGREGKKLVHFDRQRSPLTAQMADKLQTDQAKQAYRRRKWIAEPPNGWIKNVLGLRQFSMRGLHRVSVEWKLVCLALNLRRMAKLSGSQARWSALVMLTGVSLSEGGWRVRSNMLELPPGGWARGSSAFNR